MQHCKTVDKSLAFIAALHEQIAADVEQHVARVCVDEDAGNGESGGDSDCIGGLTYAQFKEMTVKNKQATVGSIFGKQLRQVEGVSAAKAVALVREFETVQGLMQGLDAAVANGGGVQGAEERVACVRWGAECKRVGQAVGKRIARLVRYDEY